MKVVIHADASPQIGTGHVVRCLSLAAALRHDGAEVTLAARTLVGDLGDRAEAMGVGVVDRDAAPRRPSWVVVDGYHLDATSRAGLAEPEVPRVVIDDLGGSVADAALVVNQNLYAGPAGPTHATDGELLAGPTYALLHPAYSDAKPVREQPEIADRILVTMGGSDPHDASSVALAALADLRPRPHIRLLVGTGHPSGDALADRAAGLGVDVARDQPSLQTHLAWADLVVSACGTTVLEAARLGRPLVGIVLADNQLGVAEALEREGLGTVVGRHPSLSPGALRRVVEEVRHDRQRRRDATERGPALVDGRGAGRVARAMRTGPLRLRSATLEDADDLLAWRNDPATRAASFDTAPVDRGTHVAWLRARLDRDDHRLWIAELAGAAVGIVRFGIDERAATISVNVAPERQGAGLGTRMIGSGCARLFAERVVDDVDAWIRPENQASVRAFRAAGFRPVEMLADRHRYRLPLTSVR